MQHRERSAIQNGARAPEPDAGRLLLVSHQFGVSGHTGGFRWHGMVRDLTKRGWRFDVLTLAPEGHADHERTAFGGATTLHAISQEWLGQRLRHAGNALADRARSYLPARLPEEPSTEARANRVDPDDVTIWRLGDRKPLGTRLKDAIIGATELMTEYVWTRRAAQRARMLAQRHAYDAVVVTSPAFLPQLVGSTIKQEFGVPYVADFRDPWYFGRGQDLALVDDATRLVWRVLEPTTLAHADRIVDISEGAQEAAQAALGDRLDAPRHYIPNGYTALDEVRGPDPDCFRVAYTGWLWPFMDVRVVLAACGRLKQRHGLPPDAFQITFMGAPERFGGVALDDLARAYGLGPHFTRTPRRPRAEADRLMQEAAVMVAFDSVCVGGLCIPSKLYHYAQTCGALLLIGRPGGAMAREAAKIGQQIYEPSDREGIGRALDAAFERWKRRGFHEPIDREGVFDARHSSRAMHDLLASLPAPSFHAGATSHAA